MPIHFKTYGGNIISGQLTGKGEMYCSDEKGNGEIFKGEFVKGKLNDTAGTYIIYTNSSFILFSGTFVDNEMDGHIEVISFTFPIQEIKEVCEGNDHCKSNGIKFIHYANQKISILCSRKIVIYSNGVQGSTLSEEEINVNIHVEQKKLNDRKIFCDFLITIVD